MLRLLCFVLLASCLNIQHASGGQYYFSTSKLITPGEPAIIHVHKLVSDNNNNDVDVTVRLVKKAAYSYLEDQVEDETLTMFTGSVGTGDCVDTELILNVPDASDMPILNYQTKVVMIVTFTLDGEDIEQEQDVDVQQLSLSIAVQTDKPIYKPGDTVQIRTFAYGVDLKPVTEPFDINIYDPSGNLIRQDHDLTSASGLHSLDLALGDNALLGDWKIKVTVDGVEKEHKANVAEYVLPKFEVKVTWPPFIVVPYSADAQTTFEPVPITVTAKYTYGQPVEGTLFVTIQEQGGDESDDPKFEFSGTLVDGTFTEEVTVQQLADLVPNSYSGNNPYSQLMWRSIQATGEVTETATGVILSGSSVLSVKPQSLEIKFPESSPKNYKPGFEYSGQIQLNKVDGSPVDDSDILMPDGEPRQIHLSFTMKCANNRPTVADDESCREMSLDDQVFDAPSDGLLDYTITEDHLGPLYTNMYVEVQMTDRYGISTTNSVTVWAFQTASNAVIRVEQEDGFRALSAGTTQTFLVTTTESISKFYYEIYSKGVMVMRDCVSSSGTDHSFQITLSEIDAQNMAPTSNLIVWYITESEPELIADSIVISIVATDVFSNKVSVSFNTDEVEPSDDVTITGTAKPGSIIALLAIDVSLTLLGSGNDITTEDVLYNLNLYQGPEPPMFFPCMCWGPVWRRRRKRSFWGGCLPPSPQAGDVTDVYRLSNVLAFTSAIMHSTDNFDYGVVFKDMTFNSMPAMPFPHDDIEMVAANSPVRVSHSQNDDNLKSVESSDIRMSFPETWIWTLLSIGADGSFSLARDAPDTITSFVLSAFALHPEYGLGVATPAELTVFKDFFVSLTLPYSVVRGEQFLLKITVFNYVEQSLEVKVTVDKSEHFYISLDGNSTKSKKITEWLDVPADSAKTLEVWVKPKTLGDVPITVTAQSSEAADQILKEILVKPEGIEQTGTKSMLMILDSSTPSGEFPVMPNFPDNTVEDSQRITVTIVGDVMGSSLQNIDSLLKMPYGCGEQNMLNFAPNIFILDYLTQTGQDTDAIRKKAVGYMEKGYQGELKYKRDDSSYSAFGNSDDSGSTWLTAFVTKSFTQAMQFIKVDEDTLAHSIQWLLDRAEKDGSFEKVGFVHHKDMMGGAAENNVALTAYVLVALLEYRNTQIEQAIETQVSSAVSEAVGFLEQKLDGDLASDYYALALTSYALCLSDSSRKQEALQELNDIAIVEGGMRYWTTDGEAESAEDSGENDYSYYRYEPPSNNIEMTSYALLATLACSSDDDYSDAIAIMKWLITQGNGIGGYGNTQATVMALQALATFAEKLYTETGNQNFMGEVMYANTNYAFDSITDSNTLLVQSQELPYDPEAGAISITGTGTGVALIQVVWDYNVYDSEESDYIKLEATSYTTNDWNNEVILNVVLRWLGDDDSGMFIVNYKSLSGFEPNSTALMEEYGTSLNLKKVEQTGDEVNLYFNEISDRERSFQLRQNLKNPVANMQPGQLKAYSYYQEDKMKIQTYIPDALVNADPCTIYPSGCGIIPTNGATSHTVTITTMTFMGFFIWKIVALLTRH